MRASALLFIVITLATMWQPPATARAGRQQGLGARERAETAEMDRLWQQTQDFYLAGKHPEARAAGTKFLALLRGAAGESSQAFADVLQNIAGIAEAMGDYSQARTWLAERLIILRKLYGDSQWNVVDARLGISYLDWLLKASPEQRTRLLNAFLQRTAAEEQTGLQAVATAQESFNTFRDALGADHPYTASAAQVLADALANVGDARAEAVLREVLAVRTRALGLEHPFTANTLSALGNVRRGAQDFEGARPLLEQALAITRRISGDEALVTIRAMVDVADLLYARGDTSGAEARWKEALDILQRTSRAEGPEASMILSGLGLLYMSRGDFARSEQMLQQALVLKRTTIGEEAHATANGLNNLAELYRTMGDYGKAVPLYEQAVAIFRKVNGLRPPDAAAAVLNLAQVHARAGRPDMSQKMLNELLPIIAESLGETHPYYAFAMGALADQFVERGEYAMAEPGMRRTLDVVRKAYGERHRHTASSLESLGLLYHRMGDLARAEPLYRESLDINRQVLGAQHPDTCDVAHRLGVLYADRGDFPRAAPLLTAAVESAAKNMDVAAALQSERQQLAMEREMHDKLLSYLGLTARGAVSADAAWARTLSWKGMVFARQRAMRAVAGRPELQKTFTALQAVTSELASLAFAAGDASGTPAWRSRLDALSAQKERLETELAGASEAFRAATAAPDPALIREAIPRDAVLVDFFEYVNAPLRPAGATSAPRYEKGLLAFIISRAGQIRAIDLGPFTPIGEAIVEWRNTREQPDGERAARALRDLMWTPVEATLGATTTVLASPDGVLSIVPLAVLPGRKSGTFLIEERAIAVVSAPRMLPDLLSAARSAEPGLLAIGDVDYDTRSTTAERSSATRSAAAAGTRYQPLPATRIELESVQQVYRARFGDAKVSALRGSAAMERTLRIEAPRHRYLHFATHGFFAPGRFTSALQARADDSLHDGQRVDGFHPGLLSGIVLAGANAPSPGEDGILTAEEVSTLDLSGVDLAVLSACETGLGQVAGGEGLLGLQRAFQTAGARTVIASMWKVDDEATRALMERFYTNLWARRMGKLEALREAQLWMLREGQQAIERDALARGLKPKVIGAGATARSPYYWGAFVLSGDWR